MESTQVAVVLDALVTTLRAAMTGVDILDGQPLAIEGEDCLVIGWSGSRPAAEITQTRTGTARDRRQETLTIACLVSCWRGDNNDATVSTLRAAVVSLLDQVRDALAANRNLGGLVTRAVLGFEGTLDQAQTPKGATATADFVIVVTTL